MAKEYPHTPPAYFGSFIPGLKRMRMSEHGKLKKHDQRRREGYAGRKTLKTAGQRHP